MIHTEEMHKNSPMAELASTDDSARLRIYTYGYEFPEAKNILEADWQLNHISLVFNGAKVEINGPFIEGSHLKGYKGELLKFRQNVTHSVDFISTDQQLLIFLTQQDDKIDATGEIYNRRPEDGNYITEFNFKTDFSLLEKFIEGIDRILAEYPPRHWIDDFLEEEVNISG